MTLAEERVAPLRDSGWTVEPAPQPSVLPPEFLQRYDWVPADIIDFVRSFELVAAPDEKIWLVTQGIVTGSAGSAFRADEFERISLEASAGDHEEVGRIREFWNGHFCLAMSVRSGYSHYALSKTTGLVVLGHEPVFEDVGPYANGFQEFLIKLSGA